MAMFGERIDRETPELHEEGVRMRFIGRRDGVSAELQRRMDWAEGVTEANTRITLFVAFNYGGRAEIVDAARTFTGETEEEFREHLYAPDMHDPDLLIRTSGEQRISNYLLWQCAYSEFVVPRRAVAGLHARGVRGVAGASTRTAGAASGPGSGWRAARRAGPSAPPRAGARTWGRGSWWPSPPPRSRSSSSRAAGWCSRSA